MVKLTIVTLVLAHGENLKDIKVISTIFNYYKFIFLEINKYPLINF